MSDENLSKQVAAFDAMKGDLLRRYGPHEWVVIVEGELKDHFAAFADAARFVAREYAAKTALVRQIESEPLFVPFVMAKA